MSDHTDPVAETVADPMIGDLTELGDAELEAVVAGKGGNGGGGGRRPGIWTFDPRARRWRLS